MQIVINNETVNIKLVDIARGQVDYNRPEAAYTGDCVSYVDLSECVTMADTQPLIEAAIAADIMT